MTLPERAIPTKISIVLLKPLPNQRQITTQDYVDYCFCCDSYKETVATLYRTCEMCCHLMCMCECPSIDVQRDRGPVFVASLFERDTYYTIISIYYVHCIPFPITFM